MTLLDHYAGCLIGLAIGDALGTTVEFQELGTFEPVADMLGGGPFGLEPGQWTDDTSMALCLAESLVVRRGFDPIDQLDRYVRWWKEGHLSCTGTCFNIGNTVRQALRTFQSTREAYPGPTDTYSAGNGCIMRLAPVPLAYAGAPVHAVEKSGESARTTHVARTCIDACRYFGGLLVGAAHGVEKERLLGPRYCPVEDGWERQPLCPEIGAIADGSFKVRNPPAVRGSGYVVDCLEAALWAFFKSSTFEEGVLLAVNLGDDVDTTGAVYDQLAGAYYGLSAIRTDWVKETAMSDFIQSQAGAVLQLSESLPLIDAPDDDAHSKT